MTSSPTRGVMTADVIVIGGGIIGLFTALGAVEAGASVVVMDRNSLGRGTTGTTFAWVNATAKLDDEAYHRMNARGVKAWHRFGDQYGADAVGLFGAGSVHWAAKGSDGDRQAAAALESQIQSLNEFSYPVEAVARDGLAALEPDIDFGERATGFLATNDRWVETRTAIRFLAKRLEDEGVRIFEDCEVTAFGREGDRLTHVKTRTGTYTADHFLLAVGEKTPAVAALATGNADIGKNFPIAHLPGLVVETPSGGAILRHVVYPADGTGFHMRPTFQGGLNLGADDVDAMVGFGASEERISRGRDQLLDRAKRYLPALDVDGMRADTKCRIGIRPMPADGKSIVGRLPGLVNAHILVTHSGVTLAPELGPRLAREILNGAADALLGPFRLSRFSARFSARFSGF